MVSILIPAYRTQDYIEECLDSIVSQSHLKNYEYEIIVGVDGCQKTFDKIMLIRHKYEKLIVVLMDENFGLFVTLNTLISLAKYSDIIKFDSDDIMLPSLIGDVMSVDADLVRFKFFKYYGKNQPLKKFHDQANGVYRIKKELYNVFGGYQPWKCAADTEFLQRFRQYKKFKEVNLDKELFYYRQHNNSLSKTIPPIRNSLRIKYHSQFKGKTYTDFKITPVCGKYSIK